MSKRILAIAAACLMLLLLAGGALAATEQMKRAAIDTGLVWLAQHQVIAGSEGYWDYNNDGRLAATAAAALAFVEEDWLPGVDFVHHGANYGDVVGRAVRYMLNRAAVDGRFGVEYAGYERYAEDYNNDLDYTNDGGNNQAIYFNPGNSARNVYTTGVCVPVVYALGERLGRNNVIGMGSAAVSGMTWAQLMQDLVDWFSWGQVEPIYGNYRGGWRYDANYTTSDNSTAQWGALPYLYATAWGLGAPQYVKNELTRWADYIQNDASGGSGYDNPTNIVNISKTGGLLLEFAVVGRPLAHASVQAALSYINGQWNTFATATWDGNFNHPYGMWAVYKGLSVYGLTATVLSSGQNILVGTGIPAAIGGFTIGFDEDPLTSAEDDWYSHYCDYLVGVQNGDGSWNGYTNWFGAMAVGWYINILNAVPVPSRPPAYIDIKPTSCPNPVNVKSKGVLPVAILGTDQIDVTMIDPESIRLLGVAPLTASLPTPSRPEEPENGALDFVIPLRHAYEDVATPYEGDLEDCMSCTTLGPDGYLDMTLKFDTQEVVAAILDMLPDDFVLPKKVCLVLTLTFSINGNDYEASDIIRLQNGDMLPPDDIPADATRLDGAFPNPFNPVTKIEYALDRDGPVELSVYDLAGRKVQTLVAQRQEAGRHVVVWDAGRRPSGVYFLRLQAGTQRFVERITLLK